MHYVKCISINIFTRCLHLYIHSWIHGIACTIISHIPCIHIRHIMHTLTHIPSITMYTCTCILLYQLHYKHIRLYRHIVLTPCKIRMCMFPQWRTDSSSRTIPNTNTHTLTSHTSSLQSKRLVTCIHTNIDSLCWSYYTTSYQLTTIFILNITSSYALRQIHFYLHIFKMCTSTYTHEYME